MDLTGSHNSTFFQPDTFSQIERACFFAEKLSHKNLIFQKGCGVKHLRTTLLQKLQAEHLCFQMQATLEEQDLKGTIEEYLHKHLRSASWEAIKRSTKKESNQKIILYLYTENFNISNIVVFNHWIQQNTPLFNGEKSLFNLLFDIDFESSFECMEFPQHEIDENTVLFPPVPPTNIQNAVRKIIEEKFGEIEENTIRGIIKEITENFDSYPSIDTQSISKIFEGHGLAPDSTQPVTQHTESKESKESKKFKTKIVPNEGSTITSKDGHQPETPSIRDTGYSQNTYQQRSKGCLKELKLGMCKKSIALKKEMKPILLRFSLEKMNTSPKGNLEETEKNKPQKMSFTALLKRVS